ncbi:copper chaperone PCu(A)C [Thermomonas flagellata]|uniref:copper chaperone PCu(A)C n=1 Tax=Thermomonas flagellata TaxID=2888524 RepID=UPI001F036301|nr:copper chaperone PCu(A)C [Thermomonas flagellata]
MLPAFKPSLLRTAAAAALLGCAFTAVAAGKDRLRVEDAWSRATPPGAPVAGGFLTIVNPGPRADVLLGASSPIAEKVEVHEMKQEGGMMRMRELRDGLPVPAGGKVVLAPGGYHLMFIQPRQPLKEGERFEATLRFRDAGAVKTTFQVRALGAGAH